MKLTTKATIILTYLLLLSSFYINYYGDGFITENYDSEQMQIYDNLREYLDKEPFGYDRTYLLNNFDASEQAHYADVKKILGFLFLMYYLIVTMLVLVLFYIIRNRLNIGNKILFWTGVSSLAFIGIVGIFSLLNFDLFWVSFHQVFFPAGNWMFSPNSLTITLFPLSTFQEFVTRFIITVLFLSAVSIIIGYKK